MGGAAAAGAGFRFDGAAAPGGWTDLPAALARLNLAVPVGAVVSCSVAAGYPADAPSLPDLVAGAGFLVERARRTGGRWVVAGRRDRTLPDFVGGGMRMLVCGLNPSLVAADAGYGYAGATNRFWTAGVAAGIVTRPRDPLMILDVDRIGMTDLVKRATPNADGLTAAEYREGAAPARRRALRRPGRVAGRRRPAGRAGPSALALRRCTGLRDALDQRPQRPHHADGARRPHAPGPRPRPTPAVTPPGPRRGGPRTTAPPRPGGGSTPAPGSGAPAPPSRPAATLGAALIRPAPRAGGDGDGRPGARRRSARRPCR